MNRDVMVADANAIGMIAVLRSLGRAGYRTHAVSHQADALGFKSRFVFKSAVHPAYQADEFIPWLRNYIERYSIRAIVAGEEFLQAIDPHYEEFRDLIPDAAPDIVRKTCLSKVRVWEELSADPYTDRFLPTSGTFANQKDVEAFCRLSADESVYFLKRDAEYSRIPGTGSGVTKVDSIDSMRECAHSLLGDYSKLFWQKHVSGLQVGVSLWRRDGKILAENMVLGLHLYPYHAGNMSLRKTWWNQDILDDAKTKLAALRWTGVAMMEYIWDPETEKFWFIELNPRFWGYLHLDLACGKDFPKFQLDAHFGRPSSCLEPPNVSCTLRYAPGEIIHIASRLLSAEVTLSQKLGSLLGFVALSLNPAVKADLWYRGDRRLYLYDWVRFLRELPSRVRKVFRPSE